MKLLENSGDIVWAHVTIIRNASNCDALAAGNRDTDQTMFFETKGEFILAKNATNKRMLKHVILCIGTGNLNWAFPNTVGKTSICAGVCSGNGKLKLTQSTAITKLFGQAGSLKNARDLVQVSARKDDDIPILDALKDSMENLAWHECLDSTGVPNSALSRSSGSTPRYACNCRSASDFVLERLKIASNDSGRPVLLKESNVPVLDGPRMEGGTIRCEQILVDINESKLDTFEVERRDLTRDVDLDGAGGPGSAGTIATSSVPVLQVLCKDNNIPMQKPPSILADSPA